MLNITVPEKIDTKTVWSKLYGSALPYLISLLSKQYEEGPIVIVVDDITNIQFTKNALDFYRSNNDAHVIPDWETLPYDIFSPHQDIISERLKTLASIKSFGAGDLLILPVNVLMQRLSPRSYISGNVVSYKTGQTINLDELRLELENCGYTNVSQVMEHGEFAVRGSIVDLYPAGAVHPYRLDLFDNEIETIRQFDPADQRSDKKISQFEILPAREFSTTNDDIKKFRERYRREIEGDPLKSVIYNDVSSGILPAGIEYYLPLFFDKLETIFDYLPESSIFLMPANIDDAVKNYCANIDERFEQRKHDIERPVLSPEKLFQTPDELNGNISSYKHIQYSKPKIAESTYYPVKQPVEFVALSAALKNTTEELDKYITTYNGRILIVAETSGRREVLLDMLKSIQQYPKKCSTWQEFMSCGDKVCISISEITEGLLLLDPEISVLTEHQIFGNRASQGRRRKKYRGTKSEAIIQNLTDLNIGSPVVHLEHGVGRYTGLQLLSGTTYETEFLTLEYAGGDKLYVPVTSLHLISRYTGTSPESAPLHKLGSDQWQKAKRRAAKQASDAAAELLDIHARRAAAIGNAYHANHEEYMSFVNGFPFEETLDQEKAIQDVISDLANINPMDRVVCGDVGFGKTEVAMRAAFTVASTGKQVAMLVPTTLLAQQHYQNFCDRFSELPINVVCLSRFGTKKSQDEVLEKIKNGTADIIVGTHKLLQKSVHYCDLGLIIIDEEHRFGVKHKEIFKSLRSEVDMLTLTATPIPRTLNMSLAGIRDLSIISTPPLERHSINTFVTEWNETLIAEACHREITRGGQVYFLHNEVKTIESKARMLQELLPEARIEVAHGQMPEKKLENVMLDFYHQRFNVLLCTTIIESGIDVPSANTIIINRADKLGLAQLHQIRGRVGRSHHRAYAYLIAPPDSVMTADAKKRLEAIESLEDLGVGFTLATHDLEIRGAGELLGENQSGQISEVGFSLYSELLEKAVETLKEGKIPDPNLPLDYGVDIDLGLPTLIPSDYIGDIHLRLILYKRVAGAKTEKVLTELRVEFIDRFGMLPEPVKNLFLVAELKIQATIIGVTKIECHESETTVVFSDQPMINTEKLIELIQTQSKTYMFNGKETLRVKKELETAEIRYNELSNLISILTIDKAA